MDSENKDDLAVQLLGLERTAPVSNDSSVPMEVSTSPSKKLWRFLAAVAFVEVIAALAIVLQITLTRETTCPTYWQTTLTVPAPTETVPSGIDLSSAPTPITWHPSGRLIKGFESCGVASSCVGLALSSDGQVLIATVPGGKNTTNDAMAQENSFPTQIQAYSLDNVTKSWIAKGSAISLFNDDKDYLSAIKPVISTDGTIVAIPQTGRVRVFRFDNNDTWSEMGSGIPRSNQANHGFGTPVAMSSDGSILAVGDSFKNQVSVFRFNGSDWAPLGHRLACGEMFCRHNFGSSVALSENGGILAVLASGGANQGYMKVFDLESEGWKEKIFYSAELHFQRQTAQGSLVKLGSSVALSGDGCTAAVSLESNHGLSHAVKVFNLDMSFSVGDLVEADINLAVEGDFPVNVALSSDGSVLAATSSQQVTVFGDNSTVGWETITTFTVNTTKNTYFSLALSKDATTIATAYTQRSSPYSPVIEVMRARQA